MPYFTLSAFAVIATFVAVGFVSSGKIKNVGDYAVANRSAEASSVAGVIMGALVAGGSSIGTVQMAYQWGLSAWWFTLGSGIGCLILGFRFAGPIRRSALTTLPELLERHYGQPTAWVSLLVSSLGTLLSVAAQFLAGTALLRSIWPITQEWASVLLTLTILAFIFAGGLKSFGAVGNAKTVILYTLLGLCCLKIVFLGQTPGVLIRDLPVSPWFNPFARGVGKDLGACLSLLVGILCTQIYIQAVFAASDEGAARTGCLTAGVLIPPIGLMAVWVGLALRNMGVVVEPALALPYFLNTYFHPALSGALWAGLAITVVGGAAGLSLGIATNLSYDVYARLFKLEKNDRRLLGLNRFSLVFVIVSAALLGLALRGDLILRLSYVGMALRGAATVVPMVAAILYPGYLPPRLAFAASLLGLTGMGWAWLFLSGIEPLYIALPASCLALIPLVFRVKSVG